MAKKQTASRGTRGGGLGNAPAVEVLEPEVPEVALVLTESAGVLTWLEGLAVFFKTAKQIERDAIARRDRVLALKVPTTKAEDAAMRQEALDARDAKKGALAHWDPITGLLSKLHKRATGGRALAVDPLEETEKFATRQHDAYVRAENDRAAAEQAALRRAEEQKAEAQRFERLAEFEKAALEAEESSPDLSQREDVFVNGYIGLNAQGEQCRQARGAAEAAQWAGFKDAHGQAARLLVSPKIEQAVVARRKAHTMRTQIEVMKEMPVAIDEAVVEAAAPQLNSGDAHSWSATCFDIEALRNAAFDQPVLGIPRDIFVLDPTALNRYAKTLEKNIERWPGVRATRSTSIRR